MHLSHKLQNHLWQRLWLALFFLLVSLGGLQTVVANGKVETSLPTATPRAPQSAAVTCEQLDPKVALADAKEGLMISKGLNLPPYLEDDLAGRIQRLKESGVHWVRLEFVATQEPGAGNPVSQIDLAYYDRLINGICEAGIAVLGLVDYQSLKRSDWAINNTVSADYVAEFSTVAAQLTDHFSDRIDTWEIWNEQDLAGTALTAESYATLLHDTYWAIQHAAKDETDGQDRVVFGGLGRIDRRALAYLRRTYEAFATLYPGERHPFDILALHPYSSELYGIETDPEIYFHWPEGEGATILHKFLKLMAENGDTNMPIWITELGWNRALPHEPSFTCPAVSSGLVSEEQQVEYFNRGFDILLRETGWEGAASPVISDTTPLSDTTQLSSTSAIQSVSKIFWYQYRDTGVYVDCASRSGERARPFATVVQVAAAEGAEVRPVAWWFGLYNGAFQPNKVQTAFRCYATGGSNCPSPTPTFTPILTPMITLTPTITPTPQPTTTGQPISTVTSTVTSAMTNVVFLPVIVRDGKVPTPTPTTTPTATPIPTTPANQ